MAARLLHKLTSLALELNILYIKFIAQYAFIIYPPTKMLIERLVEDAWYADTVRKHMRKEEDACSFLREVESFYE